MFSIGQLGCIFRDFSRVFLKLLRSQSDLDSWGLGLFLRIQWVPLREFCYGAILLSLGALCSDFGPDQSYGSTTILGCYSGLLGAF